MSGATQNQTDLTKSQQPTQQPSNQGDKAKFSHSDDHQTKQAFDTETRDHLNLELTREDERDELAELIHQNEDQLKICTKAQRFVEAEELKNKIKELKLEVVIRKSKKIEHRHGEELDKLVHTQSDEIRKFNEAWDTKIHEFRQEVQAAEKEMLAKHEKDLGALEADLKESLPLFVRTSPQIINMRRMIETLAKQKEFIQADKLKLQLAGMEGEELRKSEEQKEKKLSFILLQLVTKQKSEHSGLKKRISTAYAELIKARESEYQKLVCKLHNLRKALDIGQQLEFSRFEVAYKNFVPGERLQFKARQRRESSATVSRNKPVQNTSLNASFAEGSKTTSPIPNINSHNKGAMPGKKGFHIRGYTTNTGNPRQSNLIPINNGRYGSAQ